MKTVGCIIARTNSTRLPKKVLKKVRDKRLIEHIIEKMKRVSNLDSIYLCTSVDKEDEILLEIADENNINSFAGSKKSVIDRMLKVAEKERADHLVRITGDNIFTDEIFLDRMLEEHIKNKAEYTRTEYLPVGVTAEAMSVNALKKCYKVIDPNKSEYLTVYMFDPTSYKCQVLIPPKYFQRPFLTLTVDTPEDYDRTMFIINKLYNSKNKILLDDIIALNEVINIPHIKIDRNSKIKLPNDSTITFEGYRNQLEEKIGKSKTIKLEEDFYEENKNK